uniref:Dynactin domain-containing protein n=1 Tax=Echinostoma caproni TaxID=27848 RepID=A0A183AMT5_9TREM
LCETNDELQETSREEARELREEIEQGHTQILNLTRHLDACRETISDYEKTLGKFRDLVTELQAQNNELRRSLAEGQRQIETKLQLDSAIAQQAFPTTDSMVQPSLGIGLVSQAQTMAKVIEAELRRLEAEQSGAHVARLSAFLPDSFLRRGGDYDALLVVLLVDRLAAKADLLANHLCERYPLPACIPGQAKPPTMLAAEQSEKSPEPDTNIEINLPGSKQPLPPMTKTKAELYSFVTRLIHLLRCWSALLTQFKELFEFTRCALASVDSLAADSTALSILTGQPLEPLETAAAEATASAGGPIGLQATPEPAEKAAPDSKLTGLVGLLSEIVRFATSMRITARRIRRRLPSDSSSQPLSFSTEVAGNIEKALELLSAIVAALRDGTRLTAQLTARQAEDGVDIKPSVVMSNCLVEACKENLTGVTAPGKAGAPVPDVVFRNYMAQVRDLVSKFAVAMENGEYDFDGTKQAKPQEPVQLRAAAYKQAQAELEGCRTKLELKDEEVRELQMALKARANELSEMSVRVGLTEKRLENAGKGNEEKISRLEQRLEQMEAQQKREEREHEQAIDALHADIEALEQEKIDLKEKLKTLSKKALLEGLIKAPIVTATSPARQSSVVTTKDGPTDSVPATPGGTRLTSRDASFLTNEMQLKNLKPLKHSARRTAMQLAAELDADSSSPETPRKSPAKTYTVPQVSRQLVDLQKQLYGLLSHPKVVRLPDPGTTAAQETPSAEGDSSEKPSAATANIPSATSQLARQASYIIKLKSELEQIQRNALDAIKRDYPNAFFRADFASFPLSSVQRFMTSSSALKGDQLVARLLLPEGQKKESAPTPVALTPVQLQQVHRHILVSS